MKKLLAIFGSLTLIATTSATVISCGGDLFNAETGLVQISKLETIIDYEQDKISVDMLVSAAEKTLRAANPLLKGDSILDDFMIKDPSEILDKEKTKVVKPGFVKVVPTPNSDYFTGEGYNLWVLYNLDAQLASEFPNLKHSGNKQEAEQAKKDVQAALESLDTSSTGKKQITVALDKITAEDKMYDFYFTTPPTKENEPKPAEGSWALAFNRKLVNLALYNINYEFIVQN